MFKDHKNVSIYWFCIGLSFLFSFYSQSSNHLRHLEVGPIQGQCVDGFWGSQCEHACSENCLEGVCERATGNCSPCQFPYQTGLNCASICPENCNSGCDQLGNCFDCTETSMWGAQCENTCNYRCPNSCDVADGSCLYPFNLATGMDIGLGVVINAFGQLAFNYWLTNKLGWRGESFSARELRPAAHFSLSSGDAVSVQEYINSYVTKSVAGATFLGFLGAITGESIVMAHPILNIWPFVVGFAESQVVNVPLQYLYYLWTNRQLKRHGAFS